MAVGVGVRTVSLWDNFNLNAVFFSVICISICTYIELTRQCFFRFQLWFVWAHALCDRETTLGGRSALVRLCWQLPSKPCALKTTIDYEFVMIIDSFIKWWDREQMLGHILMQWINSIPFIIRWKKWRKIEFQSGKMRSIRNGAYAIRDAISPLNLWLHRNLFTFKTETNPAKTIWILYLLRREQRRAGKRLVWTNANTVWMLVECACVCDLLLLVLNSRSKHKKQKQTDRETDNRSNTIERFDYVFNGGVDGYKLTDLWLFADWNSKVSICTYCHQTLNRGNRFVCVYTLIFTIRSSFGRLLAMPSSALNTAVFVQMNQIRTAL